VLVIYPFWTTLTLAVDGAGLHLSGGLTHVELCFFNGNGALAPSNINNYNKLLDVDKSTTSFFILKIFM